MPPSRTLSRTLPALLALSLLMGACGHGRDDGGVDLRQRAVGNGIANIPPQCFTRTQDHEGGPVQNPCYVCHAQAREPNEQSQPEFQLQYAFPLLRSAAQVDNEWRNLFVDRRGAIAAISDEQILRHVREDNYRQGERLLLGERLARLPQRWDVDGNGRWDGYRPDAWFSFDAQGYDLDPQGRASGWRAFGYYPFPGAFMPTNGAFDDVLIRLPAAMRQREDGREDLQVYTVNLAIVEALLRRHDVEIEPTDETRLQVDLDRDGRLGHATRVVYDWAPLQKRHMHYVGRARLEQQAGRLHAAAGLFPEGTEFLHSVRYLDLDAQQVRPAPRMKELRYTRKLRWLSYSDLRQQALLEAKEAALSPDRPEQYLGDPERGVQSKLGWVYQGFIEDARGQLRPQTQEESQFCVGCHGGLSATDDGIFSFSRKISRGPAHGWHHWNERPYHQLPDPLRADGREEYREYLLNNHAGDEYRANEEVRARFFDAQQPRAAAFAALKNDLSLLLLPSPARALQLDKASLSLMREQRYTLGRDPLATPAQHVWRSVTQNRATGIAEPLPAPRLQP